jgi:meso-butanediol dehydrogenase / (S,S)-butanediol dehydrogenase / diacetyl reductase
MGNLTGKVALVTGAASKLGQGRAIALRLAKDGADVAVNDISNFGVNHPIEGWDGLRSLVAEIKSLGRKALAVEADIGSSEQVETMVNKCLSTFGKIDILANNAAATGPTAMFPFDISDEDWKKTIATNTMGTYYCCKAVGKHMIARGQGGKIIITVTGGAIGKMYIGWAPYHVSKFGVLGLTQALSLELASYKININAICPTTTATQMVELSPQRDMVKKYVKDGMSLKEAIRESLKGVAADVPLGRAGEPEDIANAVSFLASSDSDFMTGATLNVTGGACLG